MKQYPHDLSETVFKEESNDAQYYGSTSKNKLSLRYLHLQLHLHLHPHRNRSSSFTTTTFPNSRKEKDLTSINTRACKWGDL